MQDLLGVWRQAVKFLITVHIEGLEDLKCWSISERSRQRCFYDPLVIYQLWCSISQAGFCADASVLELVGSRAEVQGQV